MMTDNFAEQWPYQNEQLAAAIEWGDASGMAAGAHQLRVTAAAIEAPPQKLAGELETQARRWHESGDRSLREFPKDVW